MSLVRRCLLLALACSLAMTDATHSQGSQSGVLGGTARGPNGQPLSGVTVTATSSALQGTRTEVTRANGAYLLRNLPPGAYNLSFELEGMQRVERSVAIELGGAARLDATLELEGLEELLVVTGEAPSILETTQVGANYTAQTVDALAVGRTPSAIAELAPGVTDNTPNLSQLTISGGFAFDNVILLDGVDIGDNIFASPVAGALPIDQGLFIEDAIEETQVLVSAISAEYGRFSGGVVNMVTKSGGNDFRGSLRLDLSNASWRDETPVEKANDQSRDSNRNEVVSATLGGRIVRDKLWFFVAARDTATSDPSTFPFTNLPRTNDFEDQRLEVKLTATLAESHTGQLTSLESDSTVFQPSFDFSIDPRTTGSLLIPADLTVLSYSGILSSNLLLEARYSEKNQTFEEPTGKSRELRDSPFSTFTQGDRHYNAPWFDYADDPELRDNQQLAASLSYFLATTGSGSHDLKLGFEDFTNVRQAGNSQSATGFVFLADYLTDIEGNPILDEQGRVQPLFMPCGAAAVNFLPEVGARIEVETTSLYFNDRWHLNDQWSFNVGLRYEDVAGRASGSGEHFASDGLAPRLALSLDPSGEDKYKFDAGYAVYSGGYHVNTFSRGTRVGNPDFIASIYAGPPGVGVDFEPAFDLGNYVPFLASFPAANAFLDKGTKAPKSEELTLSAAKRLGGAGYLALTYTDRRYADFVEDFTTIDNGTTTVDSPTELLVLDNIVIRNSSLPKREYRALQLQGRYRLDDNWLLDGQWTHQLRNHGNFEGEAPNLTISSGLGDYPEILVPARNEPTGRLDDFQEHKIRPWTVYDLELGRAGDVGLSLLYRYDSARTYSLVAANTAVTSTQLANDPGYAQQPMVQNVYFGGRGSGEFADSHVFDLGVNYSIRAGKPVEPWIKLEVRNAFNDKTKVAWDTSVAPDFSGPVDEHGIWTEFNRAPTFGAARSPADYVTPREFFVSVGLRF